MKKNSKDESTKSVGTPLGQVSIKSNVLNKPIMKWVKDIFNKNDKHSNKK